MGDGDESVCAICGKKAHFYSLYKKEVFFCDSTCHQEYNSTKATKPSIILIQLQDQEEATGQQKDTREDIFIAWQNEGGKKLKELLNAGQDANQKNGSGQTLLCLAVKQSDINTMDLLLQHGADVNQAGRDGMTPLLFAAEMGNAEKVQFLLDRGANVHSTDAEGKNALHKCGKNNKDLYCVEIIYDKSPDLLQILDQYQQTPLHQTAGEGNEKLLEYFISKGADVCAMDNISRSPLHWAVIQGMDGTVNILLESGADAKINAKDRFLQQPIHYAIQSNRQDIAQMLISRNCELEHLGSDGQSSLMYAATHGNQEMFSLILKHCKNVDATDEKGWTALHHAVDRGEASVCNVLLSHGVDVNIQDKKRRFSPLFLAVTKGFPEITGLLLSKEADLTLQDNNRMLPSHHSCSNEYPHILEQLLQQSSSTYWINAEDKHGRTALRICAEKGNCECCEILLQYGAVADQQSKTILIQMGLLEDDPQDDFEDSFVEINFTAKDPIEDEVQEVEEKPDTPVSDKSSLKGDGNYLFEDNIRKLFPRKNKLSPINFKTDSYTNQWKTRLEYRKKTDKAIDEFNSERSQLNLSPRTSCITNLDVSRYSTSYQHIYHNSKKNKETTNLSTPMKPRAKNKTPVRNTVVSIDDEPTYSGKYSYSYSKRDK